MKEALTALAVLCGVSALIVIFSTVKVDQNGNRIRRQKKRKYK